jgi:nucleoid DNA-binding protein
MKEWDSLIEEEEPISLRGFGNYKLNLFLKTTL